MLTREEDIDAHALHKRGWKITAIANHLGRDRKTIRAHLNGDRVPGRRRSVGAGSVRAVRAAAVVIDLAAYAAAAAGRNTLTP